MGLGFFWAGTPPILHVSNSVELSCIHCAIREHEKSPPTYANSARFNVYCIVKVLERVGGSNLNFKKSPYMFHKNTWTHPGLFLSFLRRI